jgi:diacylglycerol kinase family enzyme
MTRGIILVNRSSGPDDTTADELRERFPGSRIVECEPSRLADTAAAISADAAGDGEHGSFVAMAGGDGSMRTLARHLRDGSTPMLVIPAGTRNHLASDLGIDDLDHAGEVARSGVIDRIDLGVVNDEVFVNNLSLGTYPRMVARRHIHQRRMPKWLANVIAGFEQLFQGRHVDVSIEGTDYCTWAVFVGNGRYGNRLADLVTRETLADGVLDVRIVHADRRWSRLRVSVATLTGRLQRSPLVEQLVVPALVLQPSGGRVRAALDGELVWLDAPLDVRCDPAGLPVLVPAPVPAEE